MVRGTLEQAPQQTAEPSCSRGPSFSLSSVEQRQTPRNIPSISMSKCVFWLARREEGLCRLPLLSQRPQSSVPRVVASCYCWCQQRGLCQQPPFSLLAPLCDFSCLPQHTVGRGTVVSPTTLCPNMTAGQISSSGTCRCLLPSKYPELHRMRGASSPGTSGSTLPYAPQDMRWAVVVIALAPMASRTSPTSLESGLRHAFSACFAVPLHTEELEHMYGSPGSPVPTVLQISTQLCMPELSPQGMRKMQLIQCTPAWGRDWSLFFCYRWPCSH